ncbi:guanine nucleotide binding protein, alpha subunit [Gorgonomyces haynaldii]|nr:guanine nucleotide binding protein, alpha subunit [Gorgonomyces haynaldii]
MDHRLSTTNPSQESRFLGQLTASLNYIPPTITPVTIHASDQKDYPSVPEQVRSETKQQRTLARQRSREIDKEIQEAARKLDPSNNYTVLILGPADAGKSTILKQMKLLYSNGFTSQDRVQVSVDIHQVILRNLNVLLSVLQADTFSQPALKELVHKIRSFDVSEKIPPTMGPWIKELYLHPLVQEYLKSNSTVLEDAAKHFLERADVCTAPAFTPSDEDIVQCRRKTEHISETVFEINQKYWHMIDVAGQLDKRSRWATYFDKSLSMLMYVFSSASYCQRMEEDPTKNRLQDALTLYKQLLSNMILKMPSVTVFINKVDLLDDRIAKHPIKDYIPDYNGDNSKKSLLHYLSTLLEKAAQERSIPSYIHKTQATDKTMMKKVMAGVV